MFSASAYERRGADIYQPLNQENVFLRLMAQCLSVRIRASCVVQHWVVDVPYDINNQITYETDWF